MEDRYDDEGEQPEDGAPFHAFPPGLYEEETLRVLVPVMREFGVVEAFGVKIGPPPKEPDLASEVLSDEEMKRRIEAEAKRRRALFYKAAS